MLYSSIENKKVKDLKKLNIKKYRDLSNKFIVEGDHLVNEAYKYGYLREVIIEDGYECNIDVIKNVVTPNVLNYISCLDNPPKILGVCEKIKSKEEYNKILILDDIQDPGNLGTIIRSCVAFNIDTLVLNSECVDIYNSKVLRATQGMIFNLNIIICDISIFINKIKLDGYKVYGTKVDGAKDLKNVEIPEKFAIIMGNEGNGVKNSILDLCDDYLYIKMNNKCESLNVAVATSIILYATNNR